MTDETLPVPLRPVHPRILEGQHWAQEHGELLAACYRRFSETGEWPRIESLQHEFALAQPPINVGQVAWKMPSTLGIRDSEFFIVRVRALRYVQAANGLLSDWHAALGLACSKWLRDENARLTRANLADLFGDDPQRLQRVSRLLLRESWWSGGGGGSDTEDWSRKITSGVRLVNGTTSADELLDKRDAEEFPSAELPEPATEIVEVTPALRPRSTVLGTVARPWRTLRRQGLLTQVMAGLIVAGVGAVIGVTAKALGI